MANIEVVSLAEQTPHRIRDNCVVLTRHTQNEQQIWIKNVWEDILSSKS